MANPSFFCVACPKSPPENTSSDGCAYLSNAATVINNRLCSESALMCPAAGGTRVVVSESLEPGR